MIDYYVAKYGNNSNTGTQAYTFLIVPIILSIGIGLYTYKYFQWKKNQIPPSKITFGAIVDSASYRYPGHWYGSIDEVGAKHEIDIIKEMGMNLFRIDLRNETLGFPDEIKKLDNIVAYGRSKNLKLYIGVYGMESWQASLADMINLYRKGGGGKASWDDFRNMYTSQTLYLTNHYKPDYIMIIVEARHNIGNQVNSERSVSEWVNYTKELSKKIKSINNGTKIILNEVIRSQDSLSSVDYVEGIMKDNDTNIDIIGIDPYEYNELNDEISTSIMLKNKYKWHGNLWVGETNIFNSKGDSYQKAYFDYAIDLAKQKGFTGFVVFYLRDMPVTNAERGIIRYDFSKKLACLGIMNKIKE